ncbi:MAG TPA: hypothetical protein VIQ31_18400, partial [Phormidium sp.]
EELQNFLQETTGESNLFAASAKRYKENFAKVAAQAKAEVEQEYAEKGESYLEGKKLTAGTKGVILGSHGFSGDKGRGSFRQAAALQEVFPEHAVVPIENKDTDVKRANPVQFVASAVGGMLRKQLKGYNQDAIDAYKEMLKIQLANPDLAEDLDFVFSGYSAGGMIGADFAEMARSQNQENVRSISFATPFITNSERDTEKDLDVFGELDVLRPLTKIGNVKHQITKAGLAHDLNNYILHPEFQEILTKFVEGESRVLSEEQNENLYRNVLPKNKVDVGFKSPRFEQSISAVQQNEQASLDQQPATTETQQVVSNIVGNTEDTKEDTKAEFQRTTSLLENIITQINQATEAVVNEFQEARLTYAEKEAELRQAYRERATKLVEELQQNVTPQQTPKAIIPDLGVKLQPPGEYLPKGATGSKQEYVRQAQANRDKFKNALKQIEKTEPGKAQVAQLQELTRLIDKEYQNIQAELGKNIDAETRKYLERYGKNQPLKNKVESQLEKVRRLADLSEKGQPSANPLPTQSQDVTAFNVNQQLQRTLGENEQLQQTARERYGFQQPTPQEPTQEQQPEFVFREEDLPDIAWSVPSLMQNLQAGFLQTVDSVAGKLIASTQSNTASLFQTVTDTFKKFLESIADSFVLDSTNFNASVISEVKAQEEIADPLSQAHEFVANEVAKLSTGQGIDKAKIPKLVSQEEYTQLAGKRATTTHAEGGLYDPVHNVLLLGETYRKAIKEGESNKHYKKAIKTLAHEHRHAQQYKLGDQTSVFFKEEYFSSKA